MWQALAASLTLAASPSVPAAAPPPPLGLLGRQTTEVTGSLPSCRVVASEPLRLACGVAGLGAASQALFTFDDAQRAQSISLIYPPQPSAAAAQEAVAPLLRLIEASRGPPQTRRDEAGREWIFSRRSFVALVRLRPHDGAWEVQTLLSDPSYRPVSVPRPGAPGR